MVHRPYSQTIHQAFCVAASLLLAGASSPLRGEASTASASADAPTAPASAPTAPRFLLVGDSMMRVGVAQALAKALAEQKGATVVTRAKSATGLARPDAFDWPGTLATEFANDHFDGVVVYLGANDGQALYSKAPVHGQKALPIPFDDPSWEKAYRARVGELVEFLCHRANGVWWLELPPMRLGKYNGRMTTLANIHASEVGKRAPCGRFVAVAREFQDPQGRFTVTKKVAGKRLRLRDDDGVHFSAAGGRLVAEQVLKALDARTTAQGANPSPAAAR